MGRPKKPRPTKEELLQFADKLQAAKHYNVSVRTIVRWLQSYDSYAPRQNYGANKLTLEQAREIRELHTAGIPMKKLAIKYHVTFATISRVVHNITHPEAEHETSIVSVIYNPH